jgi:hypothetical protein
MIEFLIMFLGLPALIAIGITIYMAKTGKEI